MHVGQRKFKLKNPGCSQKGICFSAPGKPTNLQVTSIRGRRITLKWKKPLTTAGTPDNSTLSYTVRYIHTADGSSQNQQLTVTTESAQFDLLFDRQYTYSIYVKAVRPGDHQTQGDWSDALKINTKDLGKFELLFSSICKSKFLIQ